MCGRYTLSPKPSELLTLFSLVDTPELLPRFNIAPTQTVPVVRQRTQQEPSVGTSSQSPNQLVLMRWGLVPRWAPSKGTKPLINARAETIHEKPSFKEAYQQRRCLIPASGFFEWQKNGRQKQPFYIGVEKWKPFAMAGIWEIWQQDDGQFITSCAIITTDANTLVQDLHNRMPVIIAPKDFQVWLEGNPTSGPPKELLAPFPNEQMQAVPVSNYVNSIKNEGPRCIKPAPLQQSLF